jgi:hypothetical protein
VGGESMLSEFQGTNYKRFEGTGTANIDSRNSAFNNAFGDQTNALDTTIIFIEKVVVVVEKSRPFYETVGCYAVAVCCTAIVCALSFR